MIGVLAPQPDHRIVSEFFELFKTPWEMYQRHKEYEVVLCIGEEQAKGVCAELIVIYEAADRAGCRSNGRMLMYQGMRIPIYGASATFSDKEGGFLTDVESRETVAYVEQSARRTRARLGYDLFHEIFTLLTVGQPKANAGIATVEMHICILRDLIINSGVPLVEIPPVPGGYNFIACLTHDVDHPSIRRHGFDHTTAGFLYRAVIKSPFNVLQGRATIREMLANWLSAVKLPFVLLGIARDFWLGFGGYRKMEGTARSTFFVIPFEGVGGTVEGGQAPGRRASRYGAADILEQLKWLASTGAEIGMHGIDAWRDMAKGMGEIGEIKRITGRDQIGVRMHWLYFDQRSPGILEKAGAYYDSTIGYNETIGFRAGTTQVYKWPNVAHLLELPLHIMDTALFYPTYMNLTPGDAWKAVMHVLDSTCKCGGVVTFNWHDRSITSERHWGAFYARMVREVEARGAWVASAGETVAWFKRRRNVVFDSDGREVVITVGESEDYLPTVQVRAENGAMWQVRRREACVA